MEKEAIAAASQEVSQEFKTLIDSHDLDSIKQLQHTMYVFNVTHVPRLVDLPLMPVERTGFTLQGNTIVFADASDYISSSHHTNPSFLPMPPTS